MSLSPPSAGADTREGRNRVCKQCKFSSTDAKEFYKHQVTAHGSEEDAYQSELCDNSDNIGDSEVNSEEHTSEHCEKKEEVEEPTSAHYNSDTETSAVEEDGMTSPVATMQLATGQNGLGEDVVNNNEIGAKSAFLENNPDYPGTKSSNDAVETASHSPNDSGYVHDRESIASQGDDGKERDNPLDTSDDNPNNLVIDEDVNTSTPHNDSITNEYNTPYITIKPDDGVIIRDQQPEEPQQFDSSHIKAGQSLLKHQLFPTADASPVFPDLTIRKPSPTKAARTAPVATVNGVTPPARRCAPVREAVDPAKYITVQEGDGVKYACSKCGNIYKWRKSLNKHWKEKHDGEIPEPRTGGNIPIPRLGNQFIGNSRIGSQQVSPRQMAQRPSQVNRESPYLTSLASSYALGQSAFKAAASQYGAKTENAFANMGAGSLKATPSPKGRNTNMPYYRSSPTKKQYSSNDVLSYLTSQQQIVSSFLPNSNTSPALSPPAAHSAKAVPTYIPPRSSMETPMDLTGSDLALGQSSYLSQEQEGVLDLSMKSSKKTSSTVTVAQVKPASNASIQDEPLDFSKPLNLGKAEIESVKLQSGSWTIPKPDSSFMPYKSLVSPRSQTKQCQMCSYVTRDDQDMEKHMQLHTAQEISCAECKETFTAVDDLNQHFVLRHMQVLAKRMAQVRSERANTPENKNGDQLYQYLTQSQSKRVTNCIVCGAMYQFQWAIARHFEQEHSSLPNPYQLSNSPSPVSSPPPVPTDVSTMETNAADDKLYKCTQCPFSAATSSELTRHSIRHSLNKHHVCKMCGYTARAKEELAEHYEVEHPNVQPADLKSSTGTVMLTPGDDSDDSQNGGPNTGREGSTRIIGPDGKSIIDLGSEENTAIVFPQAPEESGRNSGGSRPGRKPNSSVDVLLPYKCNVCEYRARWPSEITQHMKNHSDEKPFRCPRCTYKSKWKWDVVKHLKRCGGGTVKDVIDISKMGFTTTHSHSPDDNLAVTHARELSKGPPNVTVLPNMETNPSFESEETNENEGDILNTSSTSGSLECPECGYVAASDMEMRKHAKFHTYDVQQVYCSKCPFVGNNPAELKRHLRVHSNEKPYICKTCGYSSKWKCDLKKHCRTYNHLPAVPLTYGGHGRKPQGKDDFSDQTQSDDQMMSPDEYDSTDAEPVDMMKPAAHDADMYDTRDQIHGSGKEGSQFQCKHCDYEGDNLSSFLQHKLIHIANASDLVTNGPTSEGTGDGQIEAMESGGNRRKQSKQSIMKKAETTDSPTKMHAPADMSLAAGGENLVVNLKAPEGNAFQNSVEDSALYFRSSTKAVYGQKPNYSTNTLQHYESPVTSQPAKSEVKYKQWVPSPVGRSPSVSPAHSPVMDANGKPMFREGKKTKRRLKSCNKCGYITDNVTTLQRHMAKHGKQGKYTCNFCDYSVDKQHVVEYHMRLVHYNQAAAVPQTDSPAPSPSAIPSPMMDAENENSNSTIDFNESAVAASPSGNVSTGEQESVDFDNVDVSSLKGEDVKIVHIGNRTVYGCSKCPYNTMKVSSVLNHSKQHGANKKYTCTTCDYSTDHISHVRNHMKSIHGDDGTTVQHEQEASDMTGVEINNDAKDLSESAPSPKRPRLESDS